MAGSPFVAGQVGRASCAAKSARRSVVQDAELGRHRRVLQHAGAVEVVEIVQ